MLRLILGLAIVLGLALPAAASEEIRAVRLANAKGEHSRAVAFGTALLKRGLEPMEEQLVRVD